MTQTPTNTPTRTPTNTSESEPITTNTPTSTATNTPTATNTVTTAPPTATMTVISAPEPLATDTPTIVPPTNTTELPSLSDGANDRFIVENQFEEGVTPTIITAQDEGRDTIADASSEQKETTGSPGDQIPFVLIIGGNNGTTRALPQVDMTGVILFAQVPEGLRFVSDGSGVTQSSMTVEGSEWEHIDGSGVCDGADSDTICAFRIGNMGQTDSVTVVFNTEVVDELANGTEIVLDAEMDAANLTDNQLYQLRLNATVNVNKQQPTSLPLIEEPALIREIYLPLVIQ